MKQIVRAKTDKKEGHNSLEEFHRALREIDGNWDHEQIVTVYEFKVVYRGDWNPSGFESTLID